MAVDRTERLLNLVFCLMATRRAVPRGEIQRTIPGYGSDQSATAFERMFERDKDELRSMGIPIETVVDANGEVEGYRIPPDEYRLPPIELDGDEAAILALAAQVWDEAVLAPEAVTALRKLEAGSGVTAPSVASAHTSLVRHGADDGALLTLMAAVREGRVVTFDYTSADGRTATRTIDPWGVLARSGSWYVIGRDHDRDAMRAFRLSRISGGVTRTRTAAQSGRPADLDLLAAIDVDPGACVTARIAVRAGHGAELRRLAEREDASAAAQRNEDAVLTLRTLGERRLVDLVCAAGPGVTLLEPASTRALIVTRLTAMVEAHP